MLTVTLLSLLAAEPSAKPLQVAAPDLAVIGLEANRGALFADHLAQQLGRAGLTVVTSRQIATLLGAERQKQLMGCSDDSCNVELANALGSDAIITGSVAKVGTAYQVNISVISAKDAKPLALISGKVSSEEAVLDLITQEASKVAKQTFTALQPGFTLVPGRESLRTKALIPAAAGVVLGGVGLGLLLSAYRDSDQLRGTGVAPGTHFTRQQAEATANTGEAKQSVGVALGIVGLAAVAGAAGMMIFGGPTEPTIIPVVSPNGAQVQVSMRLP